MIEFYLNSKLQSVSRMHSDLTLLEYLRLQQHLTGTKEGCASGDCGACTLIAGEYVNGAWQYISINSCITFVSQCHNKNIISVEAIQNKTQLHPAQQAMIDCHGSQCGFCTPGFVMSLALLFENHPDLKSLTQFEIKEALAGNLCRCTGYRPIMDAAQNMLKYPYEKDEALWNPKSFEQTALEFDRDILAFNCTDESQLQLLLNQYPDARIINGATDIALEKTQMHQSFSHAICINQIPSLKIIQDNKDEQTIVIGSGATYTQMSDIIEIHFPEFHQLLLRIGSLQIRNQGTLGGNIANGSPIADTPAVLIALNAKLELKSLHETRLIALEDFYLDYKKTVLGKGEYIGSIHIPKLKANQKLKVFKISKRIEDDISAVLAAFVLTEISGNIDYVRCAFGGMAATVKRALHLEEKLIGMPMNLETFEQASDAVFDDFKPISDVRATDQYRLLVSKNLVIKCGLEICQQSNKITRIEQIHDIKEVDELQQKELWYHA